MRCAKCGVFSRKYAVVGGVKSYFCEQHLPEWARFTSAELVENMSLEKKLQRAEERAKAYDQISMQLMDSNSRAAWVVLFVAVFGFGSGCGFGYLWGAGVLW